MKMRAVVIWSMTIAAILFGILVLPFLIWNTDEEKPMNVWVVDKTVPDTSYKEHKGLMWALTRISSKSIEI